MSASDFWLKCPECGHVWSAVKLPMEIEAAARAMMAAICPQCGNDSPKTANAADISTTKENMMQSNDNAPIRAADPGLSPDAILACDWACTVPGDVSLVQHPEFQKHFGKLPPEQVTLAADELHRRGEAAQREADQLEEEGRRIHGANSKA